MDDEELDFEEDDFADVDSILYDRSDIANEEPQQTQEVEARDDSPYSDHKDPEVGDHRMSSEEPDKEEADPRADTESPAVDKDTDNSSNDQTVATEAHDKDDHSDSDSWTTSSEDEETTPKTSNQKSLSEQQNGNEQISENLSDNVMNMLENFLGKLEGKRDNSPTVRDNNVSNEKPMAPTAPSKPVPKSRPMPLSKKLQLEKNKTKTNDKPIAQPVKAVLEPPLNSTSKPSATKTVVSANSVKPLSRDSTQKPHQEVVPLNSSTKPSDQLPWIPKTSERTANNANSSGELLQSFHSIFERSKNQELEIDKFLKGMDAPAVKRSPSKPIEKEFDIVGEILNPTKVCDKPKPIETTCAEKLPKSTAKSDSSEEVKKSRRFRMEPSSKSDAKHEEAANKLLEKIKKSQPTKPIDNSVAITKDKSASPSKRSDVSDKVKKPLIVANDQTIQTSVASVSKEPILLPARLLPQISAANSKPNEAQPSTQLTFSQQKKKTEELDRKYYESVRIYLKKKKVIGYPEESFKEEAKKFKLKDNKLFLNNKEVIEFDAKQREIAIEYHLNSKGKSERSRHRGVASTVKAIDNKYFWGTIKFDVENVINQCRFCNPKDYDLTSHQLWKYIELGLIDDVMVVRDLGQKSIFNCALLDELTPSSLSDHLYRLFSFYGIPNAIRLVLARDSQKDFSERLKQCLESKFPALINLVEAISKDSQTDEVFTLPMIDIRIAYNSDGGSDLPNNVKDLMASRYVNINESDEVSLLYIFSVNEWLIKPSLYETIVTDIKNLKRKVDQKDLQTSLTSYFQITGVNLKINENDESIGNETSAPKEKKSSTARELERLQMDSKVFNYDALRKRDNHKPVKHKASKSSHKFNDSDESDSSLSDVSSQRSVSSRRKGENDRKRHSKNHKSFRERLREQNGEKKTYDLVELLDDSSQQSVLSSTIGSVVSSKSEARILNSPHLTSGPLITDSQFDSQSEDSATPQVMNALLSEVEKYDVNGICQPCIVLLNSLSHQYIEDACAGNINFELDVNAQTPKNIKTVPSSSGKHKDEIVVSDDSDGEVVETPKPQTPLQPQLVLRNQESNVKNKILTQTAKQSDVSKQVVKEPKKDKNKTHIGLNLSESSSEEEEIEKEKQKDDKTKRNSQSNQQNNIKPKKHVGLILSESSSEDQEDDNKSKKSSQSNPPKMNEVKNSSENTRTPNRQTKSRPESQSSAKSSVSQSTAKSQSKRKRKRKVSTDNTDSDDSDSDYDYRKEKTNDEQHDKKSEAKTSSPPAKKTKSSDIRTKVKAKISESEKYIRSSQKSLLASPSQSLDSGEESSSKEPKSKKKKKVIEEKLEIHKCLYCDFQTNQRQDLIMHTTKHRNEKREIVVCDICLQTFNAKAQLKAHKEENHPPEFKNAILYGCQQCKGNQFETIEAIDEHLLTHVEDLSLHVRTTSKHKCLICNNFTSINMDSMATHMTQKHRLFKCAFDCDYLSPDYSALER